MLKDEREHIKYRKQTKIINMRH